MRHIPDGMLRRLDDEPLAVPDRVSQHVAGCDRCSARRAQIAHDAACTAQLFAVPQLVPDLDSGWARLRRELERRPAENPGQGRRQAPAFPRRRRSPRVSLRAGLAIGAVGIVVAGTAAAATLTTIFSPTHVAAVSVSQGDMRAIAAVAGFADSGSLGGFNSASGSNTLRFGTITWSSGPARPVSSRAQASAAAGFPISLPAHLPAGVGALQQLIVQPRVRATMTFNANAGGLAGGSVTIELGPAVSAEYAGAGGGGVPVLAVATMRRPTAQSTGASLSQIEAFLLRQPGIPAQLAEEVRLLGDLRTILPVPVPSGASVRSVQVGRWPAVLLADSSNAAGGVVWEDGHGLLHLVVGLVDSQDVLNVAGQLG